jgi:hypothetical protein
MMSSSFENSHVVPISPLGLSVCQACRAVHPMGRSASDRTAPTLIGMAAASKGQEAVKNIGNGCLATY